MTELPTNVARDIVALIDRCAYFKEAKDGAEKEYKKSKIRLESMCAEHLITKFSTDN